MTKMKWATGGLKAALPILMLTACTPEAANAPPAIETAAVAVGTVVTKAGVYILKPTSCGFHHEDGFDDIEISGPGTAPDGEKIFFELSSTANEMTMALGADGPFDTVERRVKAGRFVSEEFRLEVSGKTVSASGMVLVDQNGERIDSNAALAVECGI
ncbi:hypothetical protein [Devosia sp. A369]